MFSNLQKLEEFRRLNQAVDCSRFQWVDYSGVLRARFVPISRAIEIVDGSSTMCLAQNCMMIPISTAPDIFSLSDFHETWTLAPHWDSLRVCGTNANHATVMGLVNQKDALQRFDKCPRVMLGEALQKLEHLVEEIVKALKKASIGVHHFHAEVWDQLEIALAAEPALAAVDSLVLAQELIRELCVSRKLKATMAPKPMVDGPTNGLHLHLSLDKVGSMSADNFLAGILSHMGSLCAFGMANYDSYARAVSDAPGTWIGFGTNNRDLPVRKVDEKH